MRWNRTVNYALLALGHMAEQGNGRCVLARQISELYSIPMDYLLKVLHLLVRGGILTSVRGPSGGYRLSKPADQVTIFEVIEVVSGPASPENALPEMPGSDGKLNRRVRSIFQASEESSCMVLRRTTVAELASGAAQESKTEEN
jgi:Rrf2 family protein